MFLFRPWWIGSAVAAALVVAFGFGLFTGSGSLFTPKQILSPASNPRPAVPANVTNVSNPDDPADVNRDPDEDE
jgi:hypothetical protein